MAQYGKNELIRRLSDYLRKGWTNQQVKDLIDSLWRDPYSPRTSGFDLEGGTDCTISAEVTSSEILGVTYYSISFTIAPVGKKFSFYQYRSKLSFHKKFNAETHSFSATEGLHVVYYDRDKTTKLQILKHISNPDHDDLKEMLQWVVPITFIYYDATNHEIIYFGNNRHGSLWNPWIHFPWHMTFNSMRETGLEFTDLVADGDGSSDTHAQFGVSEGTCFHEDIYDEADAVTAPADFPVWYFIAGNKPRIHESSVNSLVVDGLLCYNTGGAAVAATDGYFVMYHIFFTNDILEPFISVMGQDQYAKVSTATLMISSEVQDVKDKLPHQNLLHIGTLLFQTSAVFSNSYHSRIVSQAFGVITDMSVTGDGSVTTPVKLVNDEENPDDQSYYGTDLTGEKGWHKLAIITDKTVVGDGTFEDPVELENDEDYPGQNMYYGTDQSGVKGWFPIGGESGSGSGSGSGEDPWAGGYKDHVIEFGFNDVVAGIAKSWVLDINVEFTYIIHHVWLETDTGTLTGVNISINGSPVTGLENMTVTAAKGISVASAANIAVADAKVTLNIGSGYSGAPEYIGGHIYMERV